MTSRVWILGLVVLLGSQSFAGSKLECDSVPSKLMPPAVRYCALLPDVSTPSSKTSILSSKPLNALYFLHGLGQDSQSLFNEGLWSLVDELRRQNKIGDFAIITP